MIYRRRRIIVRLMATVAIQGWCKSFNPDKALLHQVALDLGIARYIADGSCRSYGNSFDMWDNPACSQGPRNPAAKRDVEKRGQSGYWWRCQLNCYTPPAPVTCTKKGPDGPTWEEPAPTPDIVSSKQPCPPKEQVASCTIQVSDVTSYANTLTNTHTVTDTTTKGQSVAIGANSKFDISIPTIPSQFLTNPPSRLLQPHQHNQCRFRARCCQRS